MIGVYGLVNILNFKFYVGASVNIEERVEEHFWEAGKKRRGYKLYQAMNEDGPENFFPIILEIIDEPSLLGDREIYWIDHLDSFQNGYNGNKVGWKESISTDYDIDTVTIERMKQMRCNGVSWGNISKRFALPITVVQKAIWNHEAKKYCDCEWLKPPLS